MKIRHLAIVACAILASTTGVASAAPSLAVSAETYPNNCSKADSWNPTGPQRAVSPKRLSPEQRTIYFAQLLDYVCSGDYLRDVTNIVDSARSYLAHRTTGGTPDGKLALVLDIDETSLSNEVQILGGSFRFPASGGDDACSDPSNGCGYTTWS